MSRNVRLKEHAPGTIRERSPDPTEFLGFNGTIDFRPYTFKVDANGFVESSHCEKLQGAKRVVLLGDSFFECAFVDQGARICDVMNELSLVLSRRLEFMNAGYAASTTLNSVVTFVAKILPMRPVAVVMCAGTFDADCWRDKRSYWRPHPWYSPLVPASPEFKNDSVELCTEDYVTLMSGVSAMCHAAGIKLFLIAKPICPESEWSKTHKYYKTKVERLNIYNGAVRDFSKRDRRVTLLDLGERCKLNWDDFYDANHLNKSGAGKVADVIFDEISRAVSRPSKLTNFLEKLEKLKRTFVR